MSRTALALLVTVLGLGGFGACSDKKQKAITHPTPTWRILVFTKTAGYRHPSIADGVAALQKVGLETGFAVDHSEDGTHFTDDNLARYRAVVFLSTTGDILDPQQQAAFERYIQGGGGFVGIHAATDTEYDWPWYTRLVGAQFDGHPALQNAELERLDGKHPATAFLPKRWKRFDEWYNFKNLDPGIEPLLNLDEATYKGGTNGASHPAAWHREFDGGRMFYTAGGHTAASFTEPLFVRHITAGILYAAARDASQARRADAQEKYYEVRALSRDLRDPMEIAVSADEQLVFIVERAGRILLYEERTGQTRCLRQLEVAQWGGERNPNARECGLLGITLDPAFADNGLVYVCYSPQQKQVNRLSRFHYDGAELKAEKVILEVPSERARDVYHEGGSLTFGRGRELFMSTGDNTCPLESSGFSPLDERPGRLEFDAQRTAGNSNDLRGSVLRIVINEDGSYAIPAGNLWPVGTPRTRPEIYIKGCRNPFRISVDPKTGWLYWGDVGPDASHDSDKRGPRGHDEIEQARAAGFHGWPYFRGDNLSYVDYDFASRQSGAPFSEVLRNDSPNNSGLGTLPPPQPAWIAYSHIESARFPELGKGGRCAMAGPVYHQKATYTKPLPAGYDNVLFIFDWSRGWIKTVRMDEGGQPVAVDPFLPGTPMVHPIDLELGDRSGRLYLLEYGSGWYGNRDGRLRRITFCGRNLAPRAMAAVDCDNGALPLRVAFSGSRSSDPEKQPLTYHWDFGDGSRSDEADPRHRYVAAGIYQASLTVTDAGGRQARQQIQITAGNSTPRVELQVAGEAAWGRPLAFTVEASDVEDGVLSGAALRVSAAYHPDGLPDGESDADPRLVGVPTRLAGYAKLLSHNCVACHLSTKTSIGPSLRDIALRYKGRKDARNRLLNSIAKGSQRQWGHAVMPPQPDVPDASRRELVQAILSLASPGAQLLQIEGGRIQMPPRPADASKARGVFVIRAIATDRGAPGVPAASTERTLILAAPAYVARR